MERDHFRRNLHRIGLCLALCTSRVAAADQLSKTSGLIESVRQGMQQFETQSRPNTAFDEAKRKVQEAVRAIESMESMSGCDEQAIVYLGSDALGELASSVVFQVGSNEGIVHFSFLSGTNLSAVVAAINTFENYLYVHAAIAEENSSRVELRSNFWGSDKFVMVKQTYGPPIVYPAATGWKPISEWTDYGCAFGSPNCATPASIFLLTKSNLVTNGAGAVTLFVVGNAGMQQFTFASGSSQANIIAALNTFDFNVGVSARQCAMNADLVEIQSISVGGFSSVQALQVGGTPPIVLDSPDDKQAEYTGQDFGASAIEGDATCDSTVDVDDLITLVNQWGSCPQPPEACPGDLTGDAVVNVDDLLRVINNWGNSE